MSECKIGLVECKYPNAVIKTCRVCVRQQFEDEILAIKKEAYQQGIADERERICDIIKEELESGYLMEKLLREIHSND